MGTKRSRDYGLAEAKARLSEVVARSQHEGPQRILLRGRPVAMVVSTQDWQKRKPATGTFYDWLKRSGVLGLGVELEAPPRHSSSPPDFDPS